MRIEIASISKACSNGISTIKNAMLTTGPSYSLQQYLPTIRVTKLLLLLVLFCSACNSKDGQSAKQEDIKFDRTKWDAKNDRNYTYRKQMVNDLLTNYQWVGVKKDSVIQMLGQPDDMEEGNLMYNYEKKPFLGGLGTAIEAVVFELAPDSTVKIARLNDGGWD